MTIKTPECELTALSVSRIRSRTFGRALQLAKKTGQTVCVHPRAKGPPIIDIAPRDLSILSRELGEIWIVRKDGTSCKL